MQVNKGFQVGVAPGRAIAEGNVLERPSVLTPRYSADDRNRHWLGVPVYLFLMSKGPASPKSFGKGPGPDGKWVIKTNRSEIARWLGTSRGGKKLKKIDRVIEHFGSNEADFPAFYERPDLNDQARRGPKRFRLFDNYTLHGAWPATVQVTISDELIDSIGAGYFKSVSMIEVAGLWQLVGRRSPLAFMLYLYLMKRNEDLVLEAEEDLHDRLGLVGGSYEKPVYARRRVLHAARVLQDMGKIGGFRNLRSKSPDLLDHVELKNREIRDRNPGILDHDLNLYTGSRDSYAFTQRRS
jgi:hypothetical protein